MFESAHVSGAQVCSYDCGSEMTGGKCLVLDSLDSLFRLFMIAQFEFSWSWKTPRFHHPGKSESVKNWKVSWNCAALTFSGGWRDCQFSLPKESPKKQLPEEVTFIRGSSRQEDDGLFLILVPAHRGFQWLKGCWCETYTNEVYENWGFWAPLCVIEFTRII